VTNGAVILGVVIMLI